MALPSQTLRTPAPSEGGPDRLRLHRWGALVAISLATLMMLMDFMAVSVALPSVRQSLGASFSEMQWVLEAFLLALAAFVLTAGYVADVAGRKLVFLLGLAVLALGSLLGGLAPNAYVLIGGRFLQGLGGALLFATGSVLLTETFRSGHWRAALAVWGTVTGLAVAFSPLLGSVITTSLGWRWIFLIDVPTSAVALLVGGLTIGGTASVATPSLGPAGAGGEPAPSRPDWRGLALFSAAIAILVVGLVRTTATFSSWEANGALACFACTAMLLVAFIAVEAVSPAPMLDISLFRQRTFTGSSIAAFGLSAAVLGPFLFVVLYLSYDLGYSALSIGVRLLLLTAMTLPFLPVAGLVDRFVPVKVLICGGLALVAAGFWLMSHVSATSTATKLVPGLIVAGVGLELVNPRLATAAVAAVKPQLAAVASRTSSTFRQVGTAVGVAVFGAVLATRLTTDLDNALSATPLAGQGPQVANLALEGQSTQAASIPGAPANMLSLVHSGFADAMHEVFLVAAIVALASAVLALSLRSSDVPRTALGTGPGPDHSPQPAPRSSPRARPERPSGVPGPPASAGPGPSEVPRAPLAVLPLAPVPPAPASDGTEPRPAVAGPGQAEAGQAEAGQAEAGQAEAGQAEAPGAPGSLTAPSVASGSGAAAAVAGTTFVSPLIDLTRLQLHVWGQVLTEAGDPLAGATVTLVHPNGDEAGHTVAAADGSFDLRDLREGTYTLVAAAPSYRPAASVVAVRNGEARASVRLLGVGSLVVKVARASDGSPIDAELELLNPDGGLAAHCQTGNDGVFILPDLLEGDYELVARRENYSPARGPVSVRRGRTGTAEVMLVGLGHLYGAVLGPVGGWLPGVEVALTDGAGDVVATTRTDDAGSYLFRDVAEGLYTVNAATGAATASVAVQAGTATVADLALATMPPVPALQVLGRGGKT